MRPYNSESKAADHNCDRKKFVSSLVHTNTDSFKFSSFLSIKFSESHGWFLQTFYDYLTIKITFCLPQPNNVTFAKIRSLSC